jgi:nitroreductase/dihydropteridine reductase
MHLINSLKWRYATKTFDPSKKVSVQDLDLLKEAVQLTASSYGLQPYKILVIENSSLRAQLKPVSWGQSQITDASHLFVFCNYTSVGQDDVNQYLKLKADAQSVEFSSMKGYADFIMNKLSEKSQTYQQQWTAKQTYIALGNLLAACGELEIDACPIEGFDSSAYDALLQLNDKGLTSAVVVAIGYRSNTDTNQKQPKVRKPLELLFETIDG